MSAISAIAVLGVVADSRGLAGGLIAGILYFLASVVLVRVFLELVIVIFRIAEYLRQISERENL
jgi:uncharacterized membrane protein